MKTDQIEATETEAERREREERERIAWLEKEDREMAEAKTEWDAWDTVRTQCIEVFEVGASAYSLNDWLRRNPQWRVVQISTAVTSERGDYGTENTIVVTCLLEKVQ